MVFFIQAGDGIRVAQEAREHGDVYKRHTLSPAVNVSVASLSLYISFKDTPETASGNENDVSGFACASASMMFHLLNSLNFPATSRPPTFLISS